MSMSNPEDQTAADLIKEINPGQSEEKSDLIKKEKIVLTTEQEDEVLAFWNEYIKNSDEPPTLEEIVENIWGKNIDTRTKKGRAVREFLATKQLKGRQKLPYTKRNVELTNEQKEYIENNLSSMTPMEMARAVFKRDDITPLHGEFLRVKEFVDEVCPPETREENFPVPDYGGVYEAPKSIAGAAAKIREAVPGGGFGKTEGLNPIQRKQAESLFTNMKSYRFISHINSYDRDADKKLFEHCFVKYTYNKEDLEQEDVDQFILLSSEVVMSQNTLLRLEKLRRLLDDAVEEGDNGRQITMRLTEAIEKTQQEYNEGIKRQRSLYDALTKKRSKRLEEKINENQSLISLVQFAQDENNRKKLLEFAEKRKEAMRRELSRLETLDSLKCEIFGINPEELIEAPI